MTDQSISPLDVNAILALANAPAPASYVNWKLYSAGVEITGLLEAAFYTDTKIYGEYETGPLKFINTLVQDVRLGHLRPAVVVRLSCYWPTFGYKPIEGTSDDHYHGGDHFDEIAALSSLLLGIRLQAGPVTRNFYLSGDPLGRPVMMDGSKAIPALYPSHRDQMVPRLAESANLTNLTVIEGISKLSQEAASVVIQSARSYQTALWFADSHPEMSWLFLVSAIEAAAGSWAKSNCKDSEVFLPNELSDILREHNCSPSVDEPISKYLREKTKSTRNFVAFLKFFLPDPPAERPEHESLRVSFDAAELNKDFRYIYGFRSRALHTGVPFPMPMCLPRNRNLKEERHFAQGMSSHGATWDFKKYHPMHFHIFEHICRGALLRWLSGLI